MMPFPAKITSDRINTTGTTAIKRYATIRRLRSRQMALRATRRANR